MVLSPDWTGCPVTASGRLPCCCSGSSGQNVHIEGVCGLGSIQHYYTSKVGFCRKILNICAQFRCCEKNSVLATHIYHSTRNRTPENLLLPAGSPLSDIIIIQTQTVNNNYRFIPKRPPRRLTNGARKQANRTFICLSLKVASDVPRCRANCKYLETLQPSVHVMSMKARKISEVQTSMFVCSCV